MREPAAGDRAPRPNRGSPFAELLADPARGLVYGNRGCLHDAEGRLRRRYAGRRWIACRLEFRGRRRPGLMMPGRYTEIFFLDEATAFAAGHRPCAECRRRDYRAFAAIWADLHPDDRGADAIDRRLHAERVAPGGGRRVQSPVSAAALPDGAFVVGVEASAWLVRGGELARWSPGGYIERRRRPSRGDLEPITPPSLLAVLGTGWAEEVPLLHPTSAGQEPVEPRS